ncbi:MAG: hypothetical protein PUC37_01665 [Spirochaetales bacterium]|nr:hypothetical protein [Spirochaetales bacterium]
MEKQNRTIGTIILQIALALLFIVSGIWILQGSRGDEIAKAIYSIFDGDIAKVICIIFGVIEIVAGVFLVIRLFVFLNTGLDTVLMIIIMICWIVAIVMIDFIGKNGLFNSFDKDFLAYLSRLASHLLVLGAIVKVKN